MTNHTLPTVVLRIGAELSRIGDIASTDEAGFFGDAVRSTVRALTEVQQRSLREDIASLWRQFDPDAAYVLRSQAGVEGLEFADDHALMRWINWLQSEVDRPTAAPARPGVDLD